MPSINFDPSQTTTAAGLFTTDTDGYVQGVAMADPSVRNALCAGVVDNAETVNMFGGIAIQEFARTQAQDSAGVGSIIKRAVSVATLTGFTVFDQSNNGIITPSANVPAYLPGMNLNFYRLGSGARIPVKCSAAVVNAVIAGAPINAQYSWDYTNNQLIPYDGSNAIPVKVITARNAKVKTVGQDVAGNPTNFVTSGNAVALIQI
jgi:hypothetical protein